VKDEDKTWRIFTNSDTNIMVTCLEFIDILNNEFPRLFFDGPVYNNLNPVLPVLA
jgi:hypothetical protein